MANSLCPFCGLFKGDQYTVQLHIEEYHTEDSPFVAQQGEPSRSSYADTEYNGSRESMPRDTWTRCTRPGCGEHVLLSEIDEHLEIHEAISMSVQDNNEEPASALPPRKSPSPPEAPPRKVMEIEPLPKTPPRSPRKPERRIPKPKEHHRSGTTILSYFSGASTLTSGARSTLRKIKEPPKPGRLGKRELGPYAFEERMPSDVRKDLIRGAEPQQVQKIGRDGLLYRSTVIENETSRLIPIIADISAEDPQTVATYLCHPSAKHVRKIYCDGNFCGYWSAQVVLSCIQYMDPEGPQRLPNVLEMQDVIEKAWDNGICSYGKIETGGVKNTRKWIGTNEALAFFLHIGVGVEALSFKDSEENKQKMAVMDLLDHIEAYFMSGLDSAQKHGTSHTTGLPPIYFQRFGHSMTIIGLERMVDGSRNLLVFDSSFGTSEPMRRLLAGRNAHSYIYNLMKPYRRSDTSLSRWNEFEILIPQNAPPTKQPASAAQLP